MSSDIQQMIADIEREVQLTRSYIGIDAFSSRVMAVMATIPRDQFVPESSRGYAFANGPLAIGYGQTISQPYIVALMTHFMDLDPSMKVLEIGTGSGYQTAVLASLCAKVYSMELIEALSLSASERLQQMGYTNIETRVGNGYHGWPEYAPYDAIMVTAAATHIPDALIEQLKPGGRLVIPVGQPYSSQQLLLVEKDEDKQIKTRYLLAVAFVPLRDGLDS